MGCDIHGIVERAFRWTDTDDKIAGWKNAGEPYDGRNYEFFSALGNQARGSAPLIRNDWAINLDNETCYGLCSEEFYLMYKSWEGDAHTLGRITLADLDRYIKSPAFKKISWKDCFVDLETYMENVRFFHGLKPGDVRFIYFMDN